MVLGVIGQRVAFADDGSRQFGIFLNLPANDEEGRPCVMLFQQFKQPWRVFRMRPVINGQPDGIFLRAKTGDDRAKPAAIGPDGRILLCPVPRE